IEAESNQSLPELFWDNGSSVSVISCSLPQTHLQFYLGPSSIFLCSFSAPPPKTMADLVKTHAWRDIDGEEGFQALEQGFTPSQRFGSPVGSTPSLIVCLVGCHWLVSNSALSVALKRILNQQRPVATLRSDPGMPSSHAQSISFISLFSGFPRSFTRQSSGGGCNRGSVYSTLWHITWNSLVLQPFASSFSVQVAVFTVAAASALGFAVMCYLTGSKMTKKYK
ncbi:hypothetical protein HID58_007965, partial [Brassica napus]